MKNNSIKPVYNFAAATLSNYESNLRRHRAVFSYFCVFLTEILLAKKLYKAQSESVQVVIFHKYTNSSLSLRLTIDMHSVPLNTRKYTYIATFYVK